MKRGMNHLVLAGRDLDAMCDLYAELGFTLTPRGQHPFGTGNAIIQLHGCYLELLAVTRPGDVVEHGPTSFSFSAFNRDYLARHEGFSMLVLDSNDAGADIEAWRAAGLQTYDPFEFSRSARLPTGWDVTVGFSLAFVSSPAAPWLGHFACQHFMPEYYAQPHFMQHQNTANAVADVWISGPGALDLTDYVTTTVGTYGVRDGPSRVVFHTPSGEVVLATPDAFEAAFGVPPPHPEDGPHLAGLTIACRSLDALATRDLKTVSQRLVMTPQKAFGTALAFTQKSA